MMQTVARPIQALACSAILLALPGCDTTEALSSGVAQRQDEVDMARIEARADRPLEPAIQGATLWPDPARLYSAARQAPAAVLTVAYDGPMAFYTEIAHLASFSWGGEDVVAESSYRTWRELHELDAVNPIPRWTPTTPPAEGGGGTRTGWTITGE